MNTLGEKKVIKKANCPSPGTKSARFKKPLRLSFQQRAQAEKEVFLQEFYSVLEDLHCIQIAK